VTHDRAFLEAVATGVLSIESQEIRQYPGVPEPVPHSRIRQEPEDRDALLEKGNRLLVLETRLSELGALLGTGKSPEEKERLDREYLELAREVRRLREEPGI
jgi:ATPase subunit of ABC transporter with duplicated ATPase domains